MNTSRVDLVRRKRTTALRALGYTLLLAIAVSGGWVLVWWIRYPHAPNVKEAPLADCEAFMGSNDFNGMTHRDRLRFGLGVVDKLRDKSFAELIAYSIQKDPARKAASDNMGKLDKDERDRYMGAFMQLFLTKFYEQPAAKRTAFLFAAIMMQKAGGADAAAKNMGIPNIDAFKAALAQFITSQPAHAQAQMGQFMLDISKEQRLLGAKTW